MSRQVTEVVLPRGTVSKEEACTLGLRSPLEWRVYTVNRVPGKSLVGSCVVTNTVYSKVTKFLLCVYIRTQSLLV